VITTRKRLRPRYVGLGLRGLGRIGLAGCEPENCGAASSVSEQWACVQRNEAKQDPITGRYCTPTSTGWIDTGHGADYLGTSVVVPDYVARQQTYTSQAPTQDLNLVNYSPRVTFTNSRGGNVLYPGDTWAIQITGGRPNSTVYVMGGKNGGSDTNRMGVSDSSGNFSLSGTINAGDVGSWGEQWSVGGISAGGFSFVVQPAPAQTTTPPPANQTTPPPQLQTDPPAALSFGGFDLSAIPWWGWLAGGAGAIFLFGGGRGR